MPFNFVMPKNTSTGRHDYDDPKTVGYEYPGEMKPVEEHVKGINFPYRGQEQHGVAATEEWEDVPVPDDDMHTAIAEPEPEHEPVPVRVVREHSNEKYMWRVNRVYTNADGNPRRLVGAMHNRNILSIVNIGTVTVWYGFDQESAVKVFGYPLAANAEVIFGADYHGISDGEVWAVADDGTQQPIAIKYGYNTE